MIFGQMSDDRDNRQPKTPPAGVKAQLAPPVPREDWGNQHTPVHPTPVETPTIDDTALQAIARRTGVTQNSAIDALNALGAFKTEHKQDLLDVHKKIDGVITTVGDLREDVGTGLGQNELIIRTLDDIRADRRNTEHVKTTYRVAEAEVDKVRQIADVEVGKAKELEPLDAAKAKREQLTKVLALGSTLAAIALAVLEATHC